MKTIIGWIALALILILALFASPVSAGLYIDLGVTYVDELGIKESTTFEFAGQTVSAEASATVDVDEYVPMLRIGYLWRSIGLEYDTIGTPTKNLQRVNLYYRFTF